MNKLPVIAMSCGILVGMTFFVILFKMFDSFFGLLFSLAIAMSTSYFTSLHVTRYFINKKKSLSYSIPEKIKKS